MSDKIKSYVKHGSLRTKLTCRNVLWCVYNLTKVREDRKGIRSDFFRVSTLPNCLFYIALECEIDANKFTIYVNRCSSNCLTHKSSEFTANILIEFEDIHKAPHSTKSFGMTQDLSFISATYDFNAIHDILITGNLHIHCSIIVKETESSVLQTNNSKFKDKIWSHCSVISAFELKEHINILLEGDASNKVIIHVENEEFPVHENMLCSISPVFSAMFSHESLENQQKQVYIEDIKKEVVGEMIKYIYTGCTSELSPYMLMELFIAADKYAISGLKERCSKFLASFLNEDLVLDILVLAHQHADISLKNAAIQYLLEKAPKLLESGEFLSFIENESEIIQGMILALIKTKC